ncbi:hypothetical protein K3495_g4459 [Podosphaera aphanis]|nr:hypothetical protein K3495_g4459 [Podosphaera aphanis]
MAYPFPSHLENSTLPSHENSHSFKSILLNWDPSVSGTGSYDEPSPGSSSGSSNSNQRSPSTPTFPNYQIPTTHGFMSNTCVDSLYLNAAEDWMNWDEYDDRALTSSPTRISNTSVNTSPATYFKTETTLPSALEPLGFEVMNSSSFTRSDSIIENGFLSNSIYCNGPETFLHLPSQHLLADLSTLESHADVCSFPLPYPSETCINLIENNSQFSNNTESLSSVQKPLQMDILGGVSMSDFSLSHPCTQLQEYSGDHHNKGEQRTQAEDYALLTTKRSDSDSNYNMNTDLISSPSPSTQSKVEFPSIKHDDFQSPAKKRKFDSAYDDKTNSYSSKNDLDLYPNKNSNVGENNNFGDMHAKGKTRPPKKIAHNMIEKRYRTNLNEKIAALRDAVPSLRIVVRCGSGQLRQSSKTGNKARKDEQKKPKLARVTRKDTTDRLDIERDDLQGLTAANKLNKATILAKATEYIAHLEHRNRTLIEEREAFRCQANVHERQNSPQNPSELSKTRVRDPWNLDLGAGLDVM